MNKSFCWYSVTLDTIIFISDSEYWRDKLFKMNNFGQFQQQNNGDWFSKAPDCVACEVLNVGKIGKNMEEEKQNVVLTLEQSLAMLRDKGLNNLDIRF